MGSQRDRSFQEEKWLVVSHSAEKGSGGRAGQCPLDFVTRFSKIGKGYLIRGTSWIRIAGGLLSNVWCRRFHGEGATAGTE